MNKKDPILVLGGDNRSFLSVIRSLGRAGYCVHTAFCPPGTAALASRYIQQHHAFVIPQRADDFEIKRFTEMLDRVGVQLVLPCDDPSIFILAHFRSQILAQTRAYLFDDAVSEIVFNKARMNELAKSLDIPLPREHFVSRGETDLDSVWTAVDTPVVLKPVSSFESSQLTERFSVKKAFSKKEFLNLLPPMILNSDVLVQENFIGVGIGVECLANKGRVLTIFQHERMHEPLHGGGSSYRKSVAVDRALRVAVTRLVEALKYTGVAMFEFKKNRHTGAWIFIEINSRFWGSLPLALAAGADFPRYLVEMLLTGKTDFPQQFKTGLYARNATQDVQWFKENLRADKSDARLASLPLHRWALEVFNILAGRERNDTLTLDDPRPFGVETGQILSRLYSKAAHKVMALSLKFGWVRRRKVKKAMGLVAGAERVLFVCAGNICRSVFAQYYCERKMPGHITVDSAGCYALNGRRPPGDAVASAARYGLDMGPHPASLVTEKAIDSADIVFFFDGSDSSFLWAHYPDQYKKKIYPLGVFADTAFIADPYEGGEAVFDEIYRQISHCIDVFVQ